MRKVLFTLCCLLCIVSSVQAQTTITINSGTDIINSGAIYNISGVYGPGGVPDSFINNGEYIDTTAIGEFNVDGPFYFTGTGITDVYDLNINSGLSTMAATVTVWDSATIKTGDSLAANGFLTLHPGATLVNNGALTGNVAGLATNASATSGACPSFTSALSLNVSGTEMQYQWQSSTDDATWIPVTGATNATYTATVTGTVYYSCSLTTANTSYAQATPGVELVYDYIAPTTGSITGASSVCTGATTALTDAAGGGVWSSSNTAAGTVSTGGVVYGAAAGVTTISYTVTTACGSLSATQAMTVNPIPNVTGYSNQAVCNNTNTAAIIFNSSVSGATYSWTNNNNTIGLGPSSTDDIASFTATNATSSISTATITVTPSANGCDGTSQTFTITVYPTPSVNSVSNQTVCNNTSTAAITFSGSTVTGTAYNWINSDATIGLLPSGTGNIASFTATNATSAINTATITVTPSANGCDGASQSFNITVYPTPSVNSVSNQTVCNNTSTAAIIFSGSTVGSTAYNWTNSDATIGLGLSGSVGIASFTATNATSAIKTATITVTPTANSCDGPSKSFTITVNPTPDVAPTDDTALCNGTSYSVTFSGSPVSNTSYAWTNSNTTTGLGASGTDTTGIFITSNTTSTNDTSTIIVTPQANGCSGIPDTFTITIYPVPNVTATDDTALCNGTSYSATFGGSLVAGTSYLWTNSNTAIGVASSGTNTIGAVTLTNLNTATDTGIIIVTPQANGCNGIPDTFMIAVYPTPMLKGSLIRPAICDNTVFSYGDTSLTAGTTFAWTMPSVSGISAPDTSGVDSIYEVLTNSTIAQATVTFVYTLTANSCVNTQNVVVTVNPNPQLSSPTTNVQCDSQVFSYAPSSLTGDSSFTWTRIYVEGTDSLGGSGTGAINDFLINNTSANVIDTYQYIITAYGCSDTELVTVMVHPTPMLSSATSFAICSGQEFSYLPESLTGAAVTYSWIRDSVAGITPVLASGTGSINEVLINDSSDLQIVTYSYTLLAYGCTNTENVYLTVNPLPVAPTITTYVSDVCDNAQNQNFGVATLPPAGETYAWTATNASVLATGETGQYSLVNFTESGNATITITVMITGTGCSSSSSQNVMVGSGTANQPYVVYSFGEFVCLENNVTSYQWGYDSRATLDSTLLVGQINQNYANSNPDTVHNLYWVITGQNGCFMKSYYNGPASTAISNVNDVTDVIVYPNPTSNYINVDINSTVAGNVTVELSNMLGQKLNEVPAKDNKAMINVSDLASGVYVIDCYREGVKIAAAKFIKN